METHAPTIKKIKNLFKSTGRNHLRSMLLVAAAGLCSTSFAAEVLKPYSRFEVKAATQAPIKLMAHGSAVGPRGEILDISLDLIESSQKYYLETLLAPKAKDKLTARARKVIGAYIEDPILANALLIDWLIENSELADGANTTNINAALRNEYLQHFAKQDISKEKFLGIDPAIWKKLEREGIVVYKSTSAFGEGYIRECKEAGVPVPETVLGEGWVERGEIKEEFISFNRKSILWEYPSSSPLGLCLALPRYPDKSDEAVLLGVICMGQQSSKACFWDNPRGKTFTKGVPVPITELVGGFDLVANGQGVCSDCHSGENPYVVHPEELAFSSITSNLYPGAWYEPLVAATWPQNPGPSGVLAGVASTQKCDSCHKQGSNGRFPDVSLALPGYCLRVLKNSVDINYPGSSPWSGTMPPYGMNRGNFSAHIDRLLQACDDYPSSGEEIPVDPQDDPGLISPPQIIEPLYACATMVSVKGAIYGAKVSLFVNGALVDSLVANNTTMETFNVPDLVAGDVVETMQEYNGVSSVMSAKAIVKDYQVDYPSGLPAPDIDPDLIYECASNIAVRHVAGAKLTVFSNGANPRTISTSTGWTSIWPAIRPFTLGQEFTAQISLCDDKSPISSIEKAVAAPANLSTPQFVPASIYPGQALVSLENLTNGSRTIIGEAGTGDLTKIQVPISWWPDVDIAQPLGRTLQNGDQLTAYQELCEKGPITETPPVERCESLPAPKIAKPRAGDTWVVVTEAVPSARIHIYDGSNIEIGDGSGPVITLSRALVAGETIVAVQQLGECWGKTGYQIRVGKNFDKKGDGK